MKSAVIDYFYVVAGVRPVGQTSWATSIPLIGMMFEHVISVENTGHFDADVVTSGQLVQPGLGTTFPSGMEWTGPLPDLRRNEERLADSSLDLSKSIAGTETLRSGIIEYVDKFASTKSIPMRTHPIAEQIKLS